MKTTEINVNTTPYSREERRIIRKYQRAYKKMVAMMAFTILAVALITGVLVYSSVSRSALIQSDEKTVTAEPYDTLWGFCKETCPEQMDIRKYIDIVIEYNDKDNAEIYVGECIHLPIFTTIKY